VALLRRCHHTTDFSLGSGKRNHDQIVFIHPEGVWPLLKSKINPGKVFDLVLSLDHVAEGYRALDERRAIKH
jgi:threonine dehydrogenase-like Zn-dependent dehydrogenase